MNNIIWGEYIQLGRLIYYKWSILPPARIESDQNCTHLFSNFYWQN